MKRFVIMGLACLALLVPARLYAAPVTIDVTGGDVRPFCSLSRAWATCRSSWTTA